MASIQKFLFDQSFDDGRRILASAQEAEQEKDVPPPPPPPPPEPTFSRKELESQVNAARAEAYGRGFAEGRVAGKEEAETVDKRALAAALERLDADLCRLIKAETEAREARAEGTVRMALSIVRKLVPAYLMAKGQAEVEAAVAAFVADLVDEAKLVIRVHEKWLDVIRPKVDDLAIRNGFAGTVTVLADPRLTELEVRADWGDGAAERDPAALWAEIERIAGARMDGIPGGPAALRALKTEDVAHAAH